MENQLQFETLLSKVNIICTKYNELATISGENFNVFKILKLSTSEVRLHSSLIGELLNPDGSHGLKNIFINEFIRLLCKKDERLSPTDYLNIKANIEIEKWIGNIDSNYEEKGFIDIYIHFENGKTIIIENKIGADDQQGQLRKYHNYDKSAIIVYLTIDGKEPKEKSTLNSKFPYDEIKPILLSYKDNIIEWLEVTKKESVNHSLLRETLTQYIYLLKYLTHQTMNEQMKNELVDLISCNADYIRSAQEIQGVWNECKFKIIDNLKPDLEVISNNLKLGLDFDKDKRLGVSDTGFWFYDKEWTFCIYFYFEKGSDYLLVGIHKIKDDIDDKLKQRLNEHLNNFNYGTKIDKEDWIWVSKFDVWDNTSWADVNKSIPGEVEKTVMMFRDHIKAMFDSSSIIN
jgi:hypothetical protein